MAENLKVDELKDILRENGQRVTGIKEDLIARLKKLDRSNIIVREYKKRKELREENERLKQEIEKHQQLENKNIEEVADTLAEMHLHVKFKGSPNNKPQQKLIAKEVNVNPAKINSPVKSSQNERKKKRQNYTEE